MKLDLTPLPKLFRKINPSWFFVVPVFRTVVAWWGEKLAIDLKEFKSFEEALK
jgi:hypothetical protein